MIFFLVTLITFLLMECVTWLTHKFVMHGFMWYFHEDHHQPQYKNWFERNDVFFNAQTAHFLQLTSHTGSMQTACKQMHMSYTKGWKTLREAEKQLGFPLLFSQSGGSDGGFSKLTPKGEEFLKRYVKMEEELKKEGERLFELYFGC